MKVFNIPPPRYTHQEKKVNRVLGITIVGIVSGHW